MACKPGPLEYWRRLFRGAGVDVLEVINRAIDVAAADRPAELRARRDRIAEKLFTLTHSEEPGNYSGIEEEERGDGSVRQETGEKESKVGSSCNAPDSEVDRLVENYSFDEAEALTEEMEEESQIVGEVLRIKEMLENKNGESDSVLLDSLRRLQLMALSVETLRATEIGRAVSGLKKHKSKQIRHLVRTLIDGWKAIVDEWVIATAALADKSPDSVNPSYTADGEGLPSPPMDEGALLATQTTSIQLSEFFDGMDDDGNPRANLESVKNQENGRSTENHKPITKQQHPSHSIIPEANVQMGRLEQAARQIKPQEAVTGHMNSQDKRNRQFKPSDSDFGPGRPPKPAYDQKVSNEMTYHQPPEPPASQRNHPTTPPDKSMSPDDLSVRAKLEAAKRKLHERYQEAENAKKQRTVQVMELQDIPKQVNYHRQPNVKPRNNLRNWAMGRR